MHFSKFTFVVNICFLLFLSSCAHNMDVKAFEMQSVNQWVVVGSLESIDQEYIELEPSSVSELSVLTVRIERIAFGSLELSKFSKDGKVRILSLVSPQNIGDVVGRCFGNEKSSLIVVTNNQYGSKAFLTLNACSSFIGDRSVGFISEADK